MTTNKNHFDKIIIGAGIFGLYAALKSVEKGEKVLVLEYDDAPFKRATWINQARVHNGYHYPRSISTAKSCITYFEKFIDDYGFAISRNFKQIYAISSRFSYTNDKQFAKFCNDVGIPCSPIVSEIHFKPTMCSGAFETLEYTFDAKLIGEYLIRKLLASSGFIIHYQARITNIRASHDKYFLDTNSGVYETPYLINAAYASLNQILNLAGLSPFKIKYELCEIALCKVSDNVKNIGITVMDGSLFSLMPFGKTEYHSLTSVSNTPHLECKNALPEFSCQNEKVTCNKIQLANCNECPNKPKSAFIDMYKLAKSYLNDNIIIDYQYSLFTMKATLLTSEVNDSRPTILEFANDKPKFLSVLSGKINTIYDLDEVL